MEKEDYNHNPTVASMSSRLRAEVMWRVQRHMGVLLLLQVFEFGFGALIFGEGRYPSLNAFCEVRVGFSLIAFNQFDRADIKVRFTQLLVLFFGIIGL